VALALACSDAAAAEVCPRAGASWLKITFAGEGFEPALRTRVLEQLGADLDGHRVVLCEASAVAETTGGATALAEVTLDLSPRSVLSLEVRDAVTDKRLVRDLSLASVPRDALALSIALAAEELLHASWIEAALEPLESPAPPVGQRPIPPVVREVNADQIARMPDVARARSPVAQAALLAAAEGATGGQKDLGADIRLASPGRIAASVRAGYRLASDVHSAHGVVHGHDFLLGLGIAYSLVPREAFWGGDVGVRVDVLDVQFTGVAATQGAQGKSGSAFGAVMSGALGGWVRIGAPWRLVAETTVGTPVHGVTATDSGSTATGLSGVEIGVALGLAATLP
jgi:hypothetical protein